MVGALVGPVILIAAAALLWVAAADIPVVPVPGQLGPDFWPRLALAGLAVASVVKIVQVVRGRGREPLGAEPEAAAPGALEGRRLAAAVALLFGYVAAIPLVGFVFATPVFLALFAWAGGYRRPVTVGACAVAGTLLLLYVFVKVVYVPLPRGEGPFLDATVGLYRLLGLF
jgi:hypothetical protein